MIYTVVIAGVWQASGFIMAMFLAGLRGIDGEIMKAAQIDGASTFQLYRRIVIPMLRPVFLSAFIVLSPPGDQVLRPRRRADQRRPRRRRRAAVDLHVRLHLQAQQMAVGSASAVIMLMTIAAIIVPYLYSELREKRDEPPPPQDTAVRTGAVIREPFIYGCWCCSRSST